MFHFLNQNVANAKVQVLHGKNDQDMIDLRHKLYEPHETFVLTASNKKRIVLNNIIREKYFPFADQDTDDPLVIVHPGELLVCLQNDYNNEVFNGEILKVRSFDCVNDELADFTMDVPGKKPIYVYLKQINQAEKVSGHEIYKAKGRLKLQSYETLGLYDYGYAITVHKAQGSQNKHAMVYCEWWMKKKSPIQYQRWLYTAVTRATDYVTIVK